MQKEEYTMHLEIEKNRCVTKHAVFSLLLIDDKEICENDAEP